MLPKNPKIIQQIDYKHPLFLGASALSIIAIMLVLLILQI